MKKNIFALLLACVTGLSVASAASFVGFEATNDNTLGNQIHSGGIIQNMVNTTLVETDATEHKYNINLISGGEGTFQMGGVTFAFTGDAAGRTAYKTYNRYIQPGGMNREIRVPTVNGEQVNIVLIEACSGILVNGISRNFTEGSNILTANGDNIIVRNPSNKPKISAILSLGVNGIVKIGDLYYNLNSSSKTAEVTKDSYVSDCYSGLTIANIPSSVTYAGVNYSVTSIGDYAFFDCSSLTSVTIPNNVTSIGEGAFEGSHVNEIHFSGSLEEWCTKLWSPWNIIGDSYDLFIEGIKITDVIIPNTITDFKDAFYGCSSLTSVTIPNSVTSIGNGAFSGCSSLTSITIPNSVTNIGNWAFEGCSSLTSIEIPNSVTSIGYSAFSGCNSLTSVTIPNSVTSIGYAAFYGCSGLTSVTIPNSVTKIESQVFHSCSSLSSVEIPNSVTSIGSEAFYGCSSLTSVTIPNSITSIGGSAFANCTGLTSIEIPNSITSIGGSAFANCSSLTSVTIPNSVTSIREKVFWGCNNIQTVVWKLKTCSDFTSSSKPFSAPVTSFTFSEDVEYIPAYLCYNMNELAFVSIGENVSSIGDYAFYGCNAMKTVVWEAKNIPDFTSSNRPFTSSISSFTFGENVEHIPAYLCYGMGSDLLVTIKAVTPPTLGNMAFSSSPAHIYVPCGSVDAYKAATNWSTYASAIKYEPLPFKISITPSDSGHVIIPTTVCDEMALTVNPNNGYVFTHWSDGNTDNPRTIELTQDTTFTALYAVAKSGTCGDDLALTWEYDDENKTLSINGNGALNSNYTYGLEAPQNMTKLVLGEGITSIGKDAFKNCSNLMSVTLHSNAIVSNTYSFNSNIGTIFGNQVKEYIIGDNVTSIGDCAFYDCSSLTSVEIPNSVTSIGEKTFYNCRSLTAIEIPNSVTSIGESAFSGCSVLTSITIPESVQSIATGATFQNCTALKEVHWNAINCDIESNDKGSYYPPFYKLSNITCFTFGDKVQKIPIDLCYGLSGLTAINIPNSVTSIGSSAFSGCSSLTSVTIPNSVTSIGEYAFYGCKGLISITLHSNAIVSNTYSSNSNIGTIFGNQVKEYIIGDNVTSIGDYAFYCRSLTSVTIPNSVTNIGGSAFKYCSIKEIHFMGTIEEWLNKNWTPSRISSSYDLYIQNDKITEVIIPNSVTSIGYSAFSGCSGLTSVTIPNSVTSIGESAFSGCSGLTSVTIPNSVTSIGYSAFSGCSSLTSVTIPNSVTSIGGSAFSSCSGLTSVTIPNSVTSIGDYAFYNCTGLTSVTIPNSVTSIGESAFSGCTGLTSVTIPNNVTSIGDNAFFGCTSLPVMDNLRYADTYLVEAVDKTLASYTIKDGTRWIGSPAFSGCSVLASIKIPNSVTSIEDGAFDGCTSLPIIDNLRYADTYLVEAVDKTLASYTIKDGTRWIGGYAFYECSSLTSVTIPNSVTSIGDGAFGHCSSLTSVTIPNSVTSIGWRAFISCSGLTSVTIPNSVTNIEISAFISCSGLTSVTIPNSVTSIGASAFNYCISLTSITCEAVTPPAIDSYVFYEVNKSIPLYVPVESIQAYKIADGWKEFSNILPISAKETETTEVTTTTTENSVDITWPAVTGANTYELVIKDKNGNIICTLIFNAQGQLISIAFNAPSRDGAPQRTQTAGFTFTVTGLDSGTGYDLTITSKDAIGQVIEEQTISFTTEANIPTGFEDAQSDQVQSTKVLHDGQVYILRGNHIFNTQGKMVK